MELLGRESSNVRREGPLWVVCLQRLLLCAHAVELLVSGIRICNEAGAVYMYFSVLCSSLFEESD